MTNKEYIENKIEDLNKKNKNILKLDEINKIKIISEEKKLTKKEIDVLFEETIKNHFYLENKKNEYNKNKNIAFDIIEKDKQNIKIKLGKNEKAILKSFKPAYLLDLEVTYNKIAKIFNIDVITSKRIRYDNKNYLLVLKDDDEITLMSELIKIDTKKIKESDEILRVIQKPLELEYSDKFKKDYLIMIIYNFLIGNDNINTNTYGLLENKTLAPLFSLVYDESIKGLYEDELLINNCIAPKKLVLNCLFENYYDEISKFLYDNLNEKKLEKAFSIIDLEVEQKEAKLRKEQLKENFELLKQMNNSKLIELYNSYGINDSESLIKYLRKNIEFGVNVKINDEMVKIPFGALESTEGKNNIKITYDNPEIIAFLNKYYLKNKEEINPLGLDVTQMLKNISASTDIINKYYVINYPHDMFKNEVGNSIEQMEFMALFFEIMGMPVKRYALSQITDYNGKILFNDTHYFMCFNENGIWKWPENALTDFRGIYEYNSLEAFIDIAVSKMIYNKELNPEKQLDEKKYVLKELPRIDTNLSLEEINDILRKASNIDIKNALYLYKCENELRKNILDGELKVFYKNDIYKEIKPEEVPDQNEYKAEFIKLLSENIMNIVYKDKYSINDFYVLNREGKLELSNKKHEIVLVNNNIEEDNDESDKKYNLIFVLLIVLIIFILWITFLR